MIQKFCVSAQNCFRARKGTGDAGGPCASSRHSLPENYRDALRPSTSKHPPPHRASPRLAICPLRNTCPLAFRVFWRLRKTAGPSRAVAPSLRFHTTPSSDLHQDYVRLKISSSPMLVIDCLIAGTPSLVASRPLRLLRRQNRMTTSRPPPSTRTALYKTPPNS